MNNAPICAVIGGGPSGLFAAERLSKSGMSVTVFDQMPTVGRKFLMAGIGGLNLTHSEAFDRFAARYRCSDDLLIRALNDFPPHALRDWCEGLGEKTFVGSSGRVFPEAFKASSLLRAWLRRLDELGVTFKTRHRWIGWHGDALRFETPEGDVEVSADTTILALGGASWPRLGSDGQWDDALRKVGVSVKPLRPANCGFNVDWKDHFREKHAGEPLKSVSLKFDKDDAPGEVMITQSGIEGGAVYALSSTLRKSVDEIGKATLHIDLKPGMSASVISERLASSRGGDSLKNKLRKATRLSPLSIALLRETVDELPSDPLALASLIKSLPLTLTGIAPIERAISTAGGISGSSLDENMMLRNRPGVFATGEMLDWDAPTGGYLLQGCFALGNAVAAGVLASNRAR